MAKRMRTIVEEAQKRRALYLRQYNKLSISIAEFAEMNQMTPARMGQLLNKAKDEQSANS